MTLHPQRSPPNLRHIVTRYCDHNLLNSPQSCLLTVTAVGDRESRRQPYSRTPLKGFQTCKKPLDPLAPKPHHVPAPVQRLQRLAQHTTNEISDIFAPRTTDPFSLTIISIHTHFSLTLLKAPSLKAGLNNKIWCPVAATFPLSQLRMDPILRYLISLIHVI